jgi:hypothetical protein
MEGQDTPASDEPEASPGATTTVSIIDFRSKMTAPRAVCRNNVHVCGLFLLTGTFRTASLRADELVCETSVNQIAVILESRRKNDGCKMRAKDLKLCGHTGPAARCGMRAGERSRFGRSVYWKVASPRRSLDASLMRKAAGRDHRFILAG